MDHRDLGRNHAALSMSVLRDRQDRLPSKVMRPWSIGARPATKFSSVDFTNLLSGSIVLNATNGPLNGTVDVLTTTNLTGGWITNATTSLDSNGNLNNYTITVDPTQNQLFILLQME